MSGWVSGCLSLLHLDIQSSHHHVLQCLSFLVLGSRGAWKDWLAVWAWFLVCCPLSVSMPVPSCLGYCCFVTHFENSSVRPAALFYLHPALARWVVCGSIRALLSVVKCRWTSFERCLLDSLFLDYWESVFRIKSFLWHGLGQILSSAWCCYHFYFHDCVSENKLSVLWFVLPQPYLEAPSHRGWLLGLHPKNCLVSCSIFRPMTLCVWCFAYDAAYESRLIILAHCCLSVSQKFRKKNFSPTPLALCVCVCPSTAGFSSGHHCIHLSLHKYRSILMNALTLLPSRNESLNFVFFFRVALVSWSP